MNNKYTTTISIMTILILMTNVAMAAVWADQLDYSPGSIVTISGDNSNGIGYSEGEVVNVSVNGPYNYDSKCSGIADTNGAWSCQVTLSSDYTAEGSYTYTAIGQTSGVTQSGTFTDSVNNVTMISPTTASPVTITSLPADVTISFKYNTSTGGTTTGVADILLATTASNSKTLVSGTGKSDSIVVTVPVGTANGAYNAKITVTNTFGTGANNKVDIQNGAVIVNVPSNIAPSISANNPSATVNEGSTVTNTGTYSDPNSGDNVGITASVGTISKTGTNSGTWSWSYPSTDGPDQSQTVTITANDGNGGITTTTFSLTVNNVAPTIAISGATNINEGSPYTLNLDSISDPGTEIVSSYKIDWGDGGTDTFSGSPVGLSKTHTYIDGPNSYAIKVDLTDEDGTFASAGSKTVFVDNVAPTIVAPSDQNSDEGSSTSFGLGSFNDPGINDNPWSVDVDWGDSSAHTTFNMAIQGSITSQAHTYADGPIQYTVTVKVTDKNGGVDSKTFKVDVNNVDPTATITGAPANSPEGTSISLSSTVTDPSNVDTTAGFTYAWTVTKNGNPFASGSGSSIGFTPDDNGNYVASFSATDKDGGIGSDSKTIIVTNVVPTVTAPSDQAATQGISKLFDLGSFSDPGVNDNPWAVDVDWGDSSLHTAFNMAIQGTITTQSHTYSSIGTYTVTVKVTDKDGGYNSKSFSIDVDYNFAGFFQPVDNNGVWNVVKAGSAIPTKFSLTGYQGMGIMYSGYPGSQKVDCTSGLDDAIEQTVTAGQSSLSYDTSADQYSYVWKSDKAWYNTCRLLTVKLNDGSVHTAKFKFK